MGKLKVGITGQQGFVGNHLYNYLNLKPEVEVLPFERSLFEDPELLAGYVSRCDVIVHLAAMNRHESQNLIYQTNLVLVHKLIAACESVNSGLHIIFSSSTQESQDNLYGKSKKEGREALEQWAKKKGGLVTGLVIPNVFGPFGKPYYNSVVATFCHQLTHNEQPHINNDGEVGLIYVNNLVEEIYSWIINPNKADKRSAGVVSYIIPPSYKVKVSKILSLLEGFKELYLHQGGFPDLSDDFEKALFNTFRCYVPAEFYPHPFKQNKDNRGMFVELARTLTAGQTSYSTTLPGITRGNHFHTRKAERFAVIKGKARIQLRKVGTSDVINYYLDGDSPSYVDMPVWYTHNITNIGEGELITVFWINEPFDPQSPDTYFETV